ncbi:hypothetical protein ACS0TY_031791 [Phlomoides rotata]
MYNSPEILAHSYRKVLPILSKKKHAITFDWLETSNSRKQDMENFMTTGGNKNITIAIPSSIHRCEVEVEQNLED